MSALRVLVIGGYGIFGGRIVALLENEPRLTLIVAGRSRRRAEEFVRARSPQARLEPTVFDRDGDLSDQLAALGPDVVVDASGPFQAYGEGRYRVVEACIGAGAHYLDLADGSEFVAGIGALDARARAAGVCCLAGASSFPVLTAAVVRHLARDLARVVTVRAGIAPSPFAIVGENVIRAIASYAGQPVLLRTNGAARHAAPFTEQMRFTIAPPGRVPVRDRLFSLVDVPDLRVLAELWPELETVWMGAAPVPEVLHGALILLARLVRRGWIRSLAPLAPLMHTATNLIRWGEHRGGMFVSVRGRTNDGRAVERSWHLLAEGEDGPLIPSMAVEALVRKLLDGSVPTLGARPAIRELELADYERLFARRQIYTGVRDESASDPLYARLLGSALHELPVQIREMHDLHSGLVAHGTAHVESGASVVARLACRAIGLPVARGDTPVTVRFDGADGIETWTRSFGAHTFSSTQVAGRGREARLLCERFGSLTFAMALVVDGARLRLELRRWSAWRIPLPLWLAPRIDAYESAEGGRFRFHVDIRHPLAGLIVRYRGELASPQRTAG